MPKSLWDVSQINQLLSDSEYIPSDDHEITIIKFDSETRTFIGKDRDGFLVFGAPQASDLMGYVFSRARLEGNKSIFISNGVSIEPVFTLRFLTNSADEISAIATIFVGLQNQIVENGSSDSAQEAAIGFKSYFAGLGKLGLSRQIQIGLFGELSFIYGSSKKIEMVNAWHSSPQSTYDFGTSAGRLEVKTSTSPTRLHWLRGSQSVGLDAEKLTYLSVYAPEVGDGLTVSDLVESISRELDEPTLQTFSQKIGLYQLDQSYLKFDLDSAIASFKYVKSSHVPRVISTERSVVQIAWKCDFGLIEGESVHQFWV